MILIWFNVGCAHFYAFISSQLNYCNSQYLWITQHFLLSFQQTFKDKIISVCHSAVLTWNFWSNLNILFITLKSTHCFSSWTCLEAGVQLHGRALLTSLTIVHYTVQGRHFAQHTTLFLAHIDYMSIHNTAPVLSCPRRFSTMFVLTTERFMFSPNHNVQFYTQTNISLNSRNLCSKASCTSLTKTTCFTLKRQLKMSNSLHSQNKSRFLKWIFLNKILLNTKWNSCWTAFFFHKIRQPQCAAHQLMCTIACYYRLSVHCCQLCVIKCWHIIPTCGICVQTF